MKTFFLVLVHYFFSQVTFANSSFLIGNGGDIVTCKNEQGSFVSSHLLDFLEFESKHDIGIDIPLYKHDDEYINKVMSLMFKRLSVFGDQFSKELESYYETFFEETKFIPNVVLSNVDDSFHAFLPKGCLIEQLAVQREPQFRQDPRYIISDDLWKIMSYEDRAGLILHELIYRVLISSQRHPETIHSRDVRLLTALTFSNKISDFFTALEFIDFLRNNIGFNCPVYDLSNDRSHYICLDVSSSNDIDTKKLFIENKWLGVDKTLSDPREIEIYFKSKDEMIISETCLLSQDPLFPSPDLKLTVSIPVKVIDSKIYYLKKVEKIVRNNEHDTFCSFSIGPGFGTFELINNNSILWEDVIFNKLD